jgi:AcrR family transcriptional regulator
VATPKTSTPRRYESPVRRQQAVETRERIIEAGCTLLRRSGIRDWRALTIRGVAQQAGVNERTVYRYFGSERGLRDAVMHRLEEKAGIELEGMRLEDVAGFAARIFDHVSSYPGRPKPPLDPTLSDASVRQKAALLAALAARTWGWTDSERTSAAALLDVLWNVASYERLVTEWALDHAQAIETVSWAIKLVTDAIRDGQRPGG